MGDIRQSQRNLVKTLRALEYEAKEAYRAVAKPRWSQRPWRNRLPHILHACMMLCFARIDLLSCYWTGNASTRHQSDRMVDFMVRYFGRSRLECSRAVKFWRHTLMHTSEPRVLRDRETGQKLTWLLHWGEEQMPRAEHFTVTMTGSSTEKINMALFPLIEDLKKAQNRYLRDLASDSTLQERFLAADRTLHETDFPIYGMKKGHPLIGNY